MRTFTGSGRAALAALFLSACGASSSAPSSTATAGNEAEITDNARREAWQVTLLEAGGGERSLLRYDVAPGITASATGRIEMAIRTSIEGQEMPSPALPAMHLGYTIETTERVGDGIRFRFHYDDVSFEAGGDPAIDARLAEMLAPLRRATGDAVVSDRGRLIELAVHVPEDLPAELASLVSQMEDMMRQVVAPLPEEPVAVGASWTHESPISSSMGLTLLQRSTYRLVAREGERIELAVRTEVSAAPGPLPSPAEGVSMTLNAMTGEGTGTLALRLDGVVPETGDLSVRIAQDATVASGGQNAPMHIDIAMRIQMGPPAR